MSQREARFKRIPPSSLTTIPVQNGLVLKGEHFAILREVLSKGINENKIDIDKILTGKTNAIVAYTKEALDELLTSSPAPLPGDIGVLFNSQHNLEEGQFDGVLLYKAVGLPGSLTWVYMSHVSLVNIIEDIADLKEAAFEAAGSGIYDSYSNFKKNTTVNRGNILHNNNVLKIGDAIFNIERTYLGRISLIEGNVITVSGVTPVGSRVYSVNGQTEEVVLDSGDIDFDKENPGTTLKDMFNWDKKI